MSLFKRSTPADDAIRCPECAERVPDGAHTRIMRLRFEDGLCQRDLAARVGISQMHVSRIIRSSAEKLSRYSLGAPEA